jgi:hypothetical protein
MSLRPANIQESHIWDLLNFFKSRGIKPNTATSVMAVLLGWQAESSGDHNDEAIIAQIRANLDIGRAMFKQERGNLS